VYTAGYHGTDGPLVVSDVMVTSLSEAFVVAGAELGHKFTDVNARFQQGMLNSLCIAGATCVNLIQCHQSYASFVLKIKLSS